MQVPPAHFVEAAIKRYGRLLGRNLQRQHPRGPSQNMGSHAGLPKQHQQSRSSITGGSRGRGGGNVSSRRSLTGGRTSRNSHHHHSQHGHGHDRGQQEEHLPRGHTAAGEGHRRKLRMFKSGASALHALAWSSEHRVMATLGYDSQIQLWDVNHCR